MEAAETAPGEASRILASDREVTRLGESVFRAGAVSAEAMDSTCAVLTRMAGLYRKLEVDGVRVVATSAIRDARNQVEFVSRATQAAGAPVEIISGREEARLIHLGVESSWPQGGKPVVILDIGGGSAEIISAEDARMKEGYSRPLGAVRLREMFLSEDPASPRQLHQMAEYIAEKLAPVTRKLEGKRWERAIATSATASAVAGALARAPRSRREALDRMRMPAADVRALYERLSGMTLAARRKMPGFGPRRAEIIVPGVAVLSEFLRAFRLRSIYFSRAGVRDGVIADLAARNVGAERARLSREQRLEVERLSRRYGVALPHARHVAATAATLFAGLKTVHQLPAEAGRLLEAAACLLDVGHFISSASHHKHSYYVVANSDLAGFTERERLLVASLCRYHRRSMPTPTHGAWETLDPEERRTLLHLIPILRLADNLDRGREQRVSAVACKVEGGAITVQASAARDIDLEQWAAERLADAFQQVYGRAITVTRVRS